MAEKQGEATEFPHTALRCLVAVAQHHGINITLERLVHDHALNAAEPSTLQFLRIAKELQLKAKDARLSWDELTALDGVFPCLARLDNGNTVILAGMRRAGGRVEAAVMDPLADQPSAILFLGKESFNARWGGEVIFLKRIFSVSDPNQPFGLRWFIPELLLQRAAFKEVAVAALALHVLALAVPIFFQLIIDKVLVHQSYTTLYVLSGGIIIAIVFDAVFGFIRQFLLLNATNKIDIRLAKRTFARLLSLPIDYFDVHSAGVTVLHMQQVDKIRQFLTGRLLLTALDASALLVFIPVLFFYSAKLTFIVLIFAGIIAAIMAGLIGSFRRRLLELYKAEGERQAMLVETIHGMHTVKSLAIEPLRRKEWDQKAANVVMMHFRVGKISITAQAITTFLEKLLMIVVIAVGAQDVFDQTLSVGALIAFQMLSGRVVSPLVQIVSLIQEYQETALSVRMLGEVMNRPTEERQGASGLQPVLSGRIDFEGVTFRYPGSAIPALNNISLPIPAGKVIGVVGRSGSGKTTLTRLIQGLYPVQEGIVRFDGIDMREIDLIHLRRSIGIVLQDSFLFRGTIRDNIAATMPGAAFEKIAKAASNAGADEFIERLPQGYTTILEEGAANLSGGQKQRLAIARALLREPRILILDEATSALDPESEAIFLRNLSRIAANRTVIIVSHRLSMLTNANIIVVLKEGQIASTGSHQELLTRCPIYSHLWNQQTKHL